MPAKKKKKPVRKMNFVKRLQKRPRMKAIRKRITKNKTEGKKLSVLYKKLVKSESRILKKKEVALPF